MKYIAVLDTDDYEDFEFFEDGKEKYLHAVDANAENGEWIYLPFKALEQESVLDKLRAEIETKYGQCDICEYFEDYDYEENDISEYRPIGNIADILQMIDKCKAEVEPQESEET